MVGLGNYTHPMTRHSLGQYILPSLLLWAEAQDAALRAAIARRVSRLPSDADSYPLPVAPPTDPFRFVAPAQGWLARVSLLVDSAPPPGDAARRAPSFTLASYPYILLDVLLYVPRLLMNVNGRGVQALLQTYPTLSPRHILLLHDELQRAFGKVSFKAGGSAAGHNGVRSVQHVLRCRGASFQEPDVARLRLGIGRPDDTRGGDVSAYVLGTMPDAWLATCVATPPTFGPLVTATGQAFTRWSLSL